MEGTDPHRRRSVRLAEFDYTAAGAYFVTVVTGGRECLLGDVVEDQIRLSPVGQIVMREWERLAERFPGVLLDEYVVMPNHVHGIIVIVKEGAASGLDDLGVERKPLRPYGPSNLAVAAGSVGAAVRAFKSAAALRVNRTRFATGRPLWQRNYYDHIIRSNADFDRIRQYIRDNPLRWSLDDENPRR